ncbi:MAG: hypothetical protein IBX43_03295 [Campylobacterales bacterium]|nr:hypothetical protein [Campylobacterales bacterium]
MPAELSKLHVRYIQTQKSFSLLRGEKKEKLPLSQLYVKDNGHFYLIIQNTPLHEAEAVSVRFSEPTDALTSLTCDARVQELAPSNEAYEDALLFFNLDTSNLKQLLLLSISALSEN